MSHRKTGPVGVIVARFQVPELHAGHRHLIIHVRERHEDVLIALGARKGMRTKLYPLTFEEREIMVRQAFPGEEFVVRPLYDHPFSRELWSKDLDTLIRETFPGRRAILYGSRGSFIPLYSGEFPVVDVPTIFPNLTGTECRAAVPFPHTQNGRAAIIYAMEHRRPLMYATSDLAITDRASNRVLLIGKKSHSGLLSFAGGHAEKSDHSGRDVAVREGGEEILGVTFGEPVYLNMVSIDDPRYRGTLDGIMTTFFRADYHGGEPSPGDDADSVAWVRREELSTVLVPWHRVLGEILNAHWFG